jgi:signal transduction histidine kinase
VADLVARALEMAGPMIQARQHRVELDVPLGLPVDADADRVAQALCNLLTNAAKFMPPGGRIAVRAARQNGAIMLRVKDDGAGLAPALRERLFQPFTQGAQPLERPHGGMGLGLAIVRYLVLLHGGKVEAHSEGEGRGSEFVLHLPAFS